MTLMAREELEIEISPTGKVTIRTKGIKGEACLDVARLYAQLLGQEESVQLTHEYRETDTTVQQHIEQKQRR
jgi:hypothetical protein